VGVEELFAPAERRSFLLSDLPMALAYLDVPEGARGETAQVLGALRQDVALHALGATMV
jgi:hypothetical protein